MPVGCERLSERPTKFQPRCCTGAEPEHATSSSKAVIEAQLLQLLQANSTPACGTASDLHAAHTVSPIAVPPSGRKGLRPAKRALSAVPPASAQAGCTLEAGAVDTRAAKAHRQGGSSSVPEHQCIPPDNAASDLPAPSLFKPSDVFDLFVPSATLPPGSSWIVSWLP